MMYSIRYYCRISLNLNFLNRISQNTQISNVINRPVGAELFHADGRADERTDRQTDGHDEANGGFSQYCERAQRWV